jgi:small-conductance mechanosensitive channel
MASADETNSTPPKPTKALGAAVMLGPMPLAASPFACAVSFALAELPFAAAKSFWQSHGSEVRAAIAIVVSIIVAVLVDKFVLPGGAKVVEGVSDSKTPRSVNTALRIIRRLVFYTIILIGVAVAVSQFVPAKEVADAFLASGAIASVIIGYASRQPIANMVAGVVIAYTQPIRIGDRVTIEDNRRRVTGRVDDITLSLTFIDPGNGDHVGIANEQLISGFMLNHSTGPLKDPTTISAWIPADTDLARTQHVIREDTGADEVRVAEWTTDGIRLEVRASPVSDRTKLGNEESQLSEQVQKALYDAGLLTGRDPGAREPSNQ